MSCQEQEYYLKIPKKYFKQGLSPTEILIVSQVMEFSNNGKPCYITDAQMAENFGTSEKTISRTLKDLEKRDIITRDTKMINGKKTRTLMADTDKLSPREKRADTDKLSITSSNSSYGQIDSSHTDKLSVTIQTNCPPPNGQIDLIKDKRKDNIKNNSIDKPESLSQKNCSSESTPQIDVSQHPNSTSVNTPKGRESTPIIYNIIDNKINKDTIDNSLEITQQQLTLLADPQLIGEDEGWQYVANGNKTFKIRKEGVSAQAR